MKRITLLTVALFMVASLTAGMMPRAHAATFNPNRIIDDSIFDNNQAMGANQIDTWLNQFPYSCISPNSGFKTLDPTGYSPTTGFVYGDWVTAGRAISDAANAYDINPQVLLATLQKEQSLVEGGSSYCNDGNEHKYAAAVGYGCPDGGTSYSYSGVNLYMRNGVAHTTVSSTCVNSSKKAGFTQQIIRAAWLLKFSEERSEGKTGWAIVKTNWDNSDDLQSCYSGPMTQGTFARCPSGGAAYYDGWTTIDNTATHMDTGPTAALYWYTPHFHGNQNFFDLFTSWFGSTTSSFLVRDYSSPTYFLLTDGTRYAIPNSDILYAYKLQQIPLTLVSDSYLTSIPDGGVLSTLFTVPGDPTTYLADNGQKYGIPSSDYCTAWGLSCGDTSVQKELGSEIANRLLSAGSLQLLANENDGVTYLMQNGNRSPFLSQQAISESSYSSITPITISTWTNQIRPAGTPIPQNNSLVKFSNSPAFYYYTNKQYYSISSYQTYLDWFSSNDKIFNDSSSVYNQSPPPTSGSFANIVSYDSKDYLVDGDRKIDITSLASDWPSPVDATIFSPLLDRMPTISASSSTSFRLNNGSIFVIRNGKKRFFNSYADFIGLGYSTQNVLGVATKSTATVPDGMPLIRAGAVIKSPKSVAMAIVGIKAPTYFLTSMDDFSAFNLNTYAVEDVSPEAFAYYTTNATSLSYLTKDATSGNLYVMSASGYKVAADSSLLSSWGIPQTAFTPLDTKALTAVTTRSNPTTFAWYQNTAYYGQGGQKHVVDSYQRYISLGGTQSNTLLVNKDFLDNAPTGSPMN